MKRIALIFALLLAGAGGQHAAAQPGSGGPAPVAPTETPIDGGASLLLAAGGAYALKRLRQRRQRTA